MFCFGFNSIFCVQTKYNRFKEIRSSQDSTTDPIDDVEDTALWLKVVGGKNMKGRVFETDLEASDIGGPSIVGSPLVRFPS